MAGRVDAYRAELKRLKDWEPFLRKHSNLPGPRGNLELLAAVVEEADAAAAWRLSRSQDEFLAACGAAAIGRSALTQPERAFARLRELASDPRWRVREGVAIGLQRFGRERMRDLLAEMNAWAKDDPYRQRAVVAALCEPPLLKSRPDALKVLAVLDRITTSLAASTDRRSDGFRVLRQTLGYGWSVAAAALTPPDALPYIEKWLRSPDRDVAWVMRSNLGKARMAGVAATLAKGVSAI